MMIIFYECHIIRFGPVYDARLILFNAVLVGVFLLSLFFLLVSLLNQAERGSTLIRIKPIAFDMILKNHF